MRSICTNPDCRSFVNRRGVDFCTECRAWNAIKDYRTTHRWVVTHRFNLKEGKYTFEVLKMINHCKEVKLDTLLKHVSPVYLRILFGFKKTSDLKVWWANNNISVSKSMYDDQVVFFVEVGDTIYVFGR